MFQCVMLCSFCVNTSISFGFISSTFAQSYLNVSGATLTQWGWDKMDAIWQTTFSNTFSCKKLFEFRLKFHWSLLLRVQLLIFHHWFRQWLGAGQVTSHCMHQWLLVYWCIYVSHGLNELKNMAKYITWHNNNKTSMTKTVCIFYGTYCI